MQQQEQQQQEQQQEYTIIIQDRNYAQWSGAPPGVSPSENKLFNNDVFTIAAPSTVEIKHSPVRNATGIPGVLVLKNNKTYGRSAAKSGKLLYKCIPDDMRLPSFLVAYEIKNMGFSKVFHNIYIIFQFKEWSQKEKHPHAIITQTIGPVDVLEHFYEYQLYCKNLNASIQNFMKETATKTKAKSKSFIEDCKDRKLMYEDRQSWKIFTIDPQNSTDLDDAFSIRIQENGEILLSIYISNVTVWMDALDLWDSFSRRISTIYLPDRKRPMLPAILSDGLCSLLSGTTRVAFVMDITITSSRTIRDIRYSNCMIQVYKNYAYEEPDLLKDVNYMLLLQTAKELIPAYKYITHSHVRDSHDVVSYFMIMMNYCTAQELMQHKNGIFRTTNCAVTCEPNELPQDVMKCIQKVSGQYIDMSALKEGDTVTHEAMQMNAYVQITSPIRRLVDLLNMIQFQMNQGSGVSEKATQFYNKWLGEMEYINTTMRSIRRVQNDCCLLDYCTNTPRAFERVYTGYILDIMREVEVDFTYCTVYLPELKLTSHRVVLGNSVKRYEKYDFKLYLFHDEEKFKKKIRLAKISE